MTGSIPDPRLEAALRAVGAHFQHNPGWYREGVAIALIAADAHDEASGVRRVTAQQLADQLELARTEEQKRLNGLRDKALSYNGEKLCPRCANGFPVCSAGIPHYDSCSRYRWALDVCPACEVEMAAESAADSPVGGVS